MSARIASYEILHCDAGWRTLSFLKMVSDDGTIGWAEFNECYGSLGLDAVLDAMASLVVGCDPMQTERIMAMLYAMSRQLPGGLNAQAMAAVENSLLDIKGKILGVPVSMLFGGAVRERLALYWSHCGTRRIAFQDMLGSPPMNSLEDVARQGREVAASGFQALKTNIMRFRQGTASIYMPGFGQTEHAPSLTPPHSLMQEILDELAAFRKGAGNNTEIFLDLNFNFKPETLKLIATALEPLGLGWIEIDLYDPQALARLRASIRTPIASGESLFGRRSYRPYFEAGAVDIAIIDVIWNGFGESVKIASMADAYEINVAPHNFYGHLATAISAHFCALVPNFRIMEIDVDEVPWMDDLFSWSPAIRNGTLQLPEGPGWGVNVNEAALRAHPPRAEARSELMKPVAGILSEGVLPTLHID
ncbi:mandelate racemase/muconate lactonizing enzyme family protein [Phyllobacterium sp. SB3]|uniref:mandelate racemase/muconate lactonizing enzyme family protein n=1 Tax=Phyllobacterium sp. SB3 TaxID=3156073 RepID=UPI0032AED6F5